MKCGMNFREDTQYLCFFFYVIRDMVAAKPECSIAELREVKRKADKIEIYFKLFLLFHHKSASQDPKIESKNGWN